MSITKQTRQKRIYWGLFDKQGKMEAVTFSYYGAAHPKEKKYRRISRKTFREYLTRVRA